MPSKPVKPKIKIEEITEDQPVEPKSEETTPKISSFSQLDAMKTPEKSVPEENKEVQVSDEAKPVGIKEESSEPPAPIKDAPTGNSPVAKDEPSMSSDNVKDWLKDIRPDTTKDVEKSGGFNFKLFFAFVLIFALLGALVGGIFYYKQNVSVNKPADNDQNTVVETPVSTPTPTPESAIDLKKYKVNVLNGSGIKGEAGKVKNLLTSAGFTDDNVDTGNANTYDHKSTSVSLKKGVSDEVFDKIKTALGSGYSVEKAVATLSDSSKYDIEITVGNGK